MWPLLYEFHHWPHNALIPSLAFTSWSWRFHAHFSSRFWSPQLRKRSSHTVECWTDLWLLPEAQLRKARERCSRVVTSWGYGQTFVDHFHSTCLKPSSFVEKYFKDDIIFRVIKRSGCETVIFPSVGWEDVACFAYFGHFKEKFNKSY